MYLKINAKRKNLMKLYVLLPIISIFIIAMTSHNEFLSTPYIIKMGIALLLIILYPSSLFFEIEEEL